MSLAVMAVGTGRLTVRSVATSAVVPLGLVLSLIAVYIMLFTGWKGEEWYSARPYRYDEVQR